MRPSEIHNNVKQLKAQASPDLDCRVHKGIDEALAQNSNRSTVHHEPFKGRTFMKNPFSKIAIAAVVVIAAILMFGPGESVSFAKVRQYLLNYNTIELDFFASEEGSGPVIHDIIKGNRIRRTVSNVDNIMILDLDSAKMLVLSPAEKGAIIVDIQGTVQEGTQHLLDMVRSIVSKVDENPEIVVEELGRRDFDGVEAVGFKVRGPHSRLNLWADPVTGTPKRIELGVGQNVSILTNIEFDVPVPDDLVSMEPPDGYTMNEQTMTMGEGTEEDWVATLGIWAEHINHGMFPDAVGVPELLELQPTLVTALGQMDGSKQDLTEIGMQYGRSTLFLTVLSNDGEWHYAGQGVEFGDSDTAVFWYRQGESKTYRVIYGDLHVEEVPLDGLPQ